MKFTAHKFRYPQKFLANGSIIARLEISENRLRFSIGSPVGTLISRDESPGFGFLRASIIILGMMFCVVRVARRSGAILPWC